MCTFHCIYNLIDWNSFVYLWFIIIINVFYIFIPRAFYYIISPGPFITAKWFQFFNQEAFLSIYQFSHFPTELFWVVLKYFVVSKEFCSFFISVDIWLFASFSLLFTGSYKLMLSRIFKFFAFLFSTLTPLFTLSSLAIFHMYIAIPFYIFNFQLGALNLFSISVLVSAFITQAVVYIISFKSIRFPLKTRRSYSMTKLANFICISLFLIL